MEGIMVVTCTVSSFQCVLCSFPEVEDEKKKADEIKQAYYSCKSLTELTDFQKHLLEIFLTIH